MRMALLMQSLIKEQSIQFSAEMEAVLMLTRCFQKSIEFFLHQGSISASLMACLTKDKGISRSMNLIGFHSCIKLQSQPYQHQQLLRMKTRMRKTSTISLFLENKQEIKINNEVTTRLFSLSKKLKILYTFYHPPTYSISFFIDLFSLLLSYFSVNSVSSSFFMSIANCSSLFCFSNFFNFVRASIFMQRNFFLIA